MIIDDERYLVIDAQRETGWPVSADSQPLTRVSHLAAAPSRRKRQNETVKPERQPLAGVRQHGGQMSDKKGWQNGNDERTEAKSGAATRSQTVMRVGDMGAG